MRDDIGGGEGHVIYVGESAGRGGVLGAVCVNERCTRDTLKIQV